MRSFLGQCDSWLSFGKNNQNWYHPNDWYLYTDNYPSCEMFPGVKKYFLPLKSFIKRKKTTFCWTRIPILLESLCPCRCLVCSEYQGYWILNIGGVCWSLLTIGLLTSDRRHCWTSQYEEQQLDILSLRCPGSQRLLHSGIQFAEQKFAEVTKHLVVNRTSVECCHDPGTMLMSLPGSLVLHLRRSTTPLRTESWDPLPRRSPVSWPRRWSSPPRSSLSSLESSPERLAPVRPTG